jgi:hypothetical protein
MVHDAFGDVTGVDVEPFQIADCRERLGALRGVTFSLASELAENRRWNVITCMEVLEHCLEPERRRIIGLLARLCERHGRVIISVPIETGLSVAGKQAVRAIAGLRGLGDYAHRERYSPLEMVRAICGGAVPRVVFSGSAAAGTFSYYGHKGFDWREVEAEIAGAMTVERRMFTPLPLGGLLNSQVWFVCRPRT